MGQRGRPGGERNARHHRADPAAGPPPPPPSTTTAAGTAVPSPAPGRVRAVELGCFGEKAADLSARPFALTLAKPAPAPQSLPPAAAAARYDDAAQCQVLLDPDSQLARDLIPLVTYLRRQRHQHDHGES